MSAERRVVRLHKLELFNWGTFDSSKGQVYVIRPEGETTLLIGTNGSGKSTLVDALLTLLVKQSIRNFNVAAGGKKRERTERTYVMGAYDRSASESGEGIQVKYLRPKLKQPSVILAWFHNEETGTGFTIAQVLYLTTDQSVEKIYCFSEGERSTEEIVSDLSSTDGMHKVLAEHGFRTTKTFVEAERWFARATHIKPKAMEVFNQTVAVKDIQRLNDFIRNHMLEPKNWSEKVDRLLDHFSQLSAAHRTLVRVRQQLDLLEPVASAGDEFARRTEELERAEGVLAAIGSFFSQRIVDLFVPETERLGRQLNAAQADRKGVTAEIEQLEERRRGLKNEIDRTGGDRLRQIPTLIEKERAWERAKTQERERYEQALKKAGLSADVGTEAEFQQVRSRLAERREALDGQLAELEQARTEQTVERAGMRRDLHAATAEAEALSARKDNLPGWCVAVRARLCEQLGVAEKKLPFAAELIAVRETEREWEASIEKVLRGFALTLLVPSELYEDVCRIVEDTRLADARGRGRRLVYAVAGEPTGEVAEPKNADSLLHKLRFKARHPLSGWVKAELVKRFDYRCCEDLETFRKHRGKALTRSRHTKAGKGRRHEKDDRAQATEARNFVLGWNNTDKLEHVAAEAERLKTRESEVGEQLRALDAQLEALRRQRSALEEVERFWTYTEIAVEPHTREIAALEREKKDIETGSDVIGGLKERLAETESTRQALQDKRDDLVGTERELKRRIAEAEQLIANAQADLGEREAAGLLKTHRAHFDELAAQLGDVELTLESLFSVRDRFRDEQETRAHRLRDKLEPVQDHLTSAMADFLRLAPEEAADLQATPEYLESFLGLRERILYDDLPRHEQRFKKRLNERVTEEIGLFRAGLEQERREIEDKIVVLNESLRQVEYRPGQFIQLEGRRVHDREIADFQARLKSCLEDSFDTSEDANEARFQRISELIEKLADENNRRWRDKVIDVRRWLDFIANVVDADSGETVSSYDDSTGQSGGEKAKLAFTILVAAIAYQYDLDPEAEASDRFGFVVVDEMFSKVDDQHAEYALDLFKQFGLQLLIVAPLDAKARVTQPYVGRYLHVNKRQHVSEVFQMTARQFQKHLNAAASS